MVNATAKPEMQRKSFVAQPVWCAHEVPRELADRILNLQSKGFLEGVPLNTETAAVKPRVGIER
jgi:hypothetical protein